MEVNKEENKKDQASQVAPNENINCLSDLKPMKTMKRWLMIVNPSRRKRQKMVKRKQRRSARRDLTRTKRGSTSIEMTQTVS